MMGMNTTGRVDGTKSALFLRSNGSGKTSETQYGKTVGDAKLSEEGAKYYEELKKKFGNYDFILVSKDEMENAKSHAASYANGLKTVVLIDEDKIERMATDKEYRKKYEGILDGTKAQIEQLKEKLTATGAPIAGLGLQVGENGEISYFAVLKKSGDAQKARIESKREQVRAEKKAEAKKASKKEKEAKLKEKIDEKRSERRDNLKPEDTTVISANSIDELIRQIEDSQFAYRANTLRTEGELSLGQSIDFRG